MRWLNKNLLVVLGHVGLSVCALASPAQLPASFPPDSFRAREYLVLTPNMYASDTAKAMLAKGGNAIDAAVAAQLVLCLVEPQFAGIGGGGLLLHYDHVKHESHVYNGRETAPEAATDTMFLDQDSQRTRDPLNAAASGLSVAVPGLLAMLKKAHDDHGRLTWHEVLIPAITLAEQGFIVSERLSAGLERRCDVRSSATVFPKMNPTYFLSDICIPVPQGEFLSNEAFAGTLSRLANEGIKPFYEGDIADAIVEVVRHNYLESGVLAATDLQTYQPTVGTLLCAEYHGYKVCGAPLPAAGTVALLQLLGIVESLNMKHYNPDDAEMAHVFAEATRLAFADSATYLADPNFSDAPLKEMLNPEYLKKRGASINNRQIESEVLPGSISTKISYGASKPYVYEGAISMNILDQEGNAVVLTSTMGEDFGSWLSTGGFMLNSSMIDFSFDSEKFRKVIANKIAPKKRPLTFMTPIMVFNRDGSLKAMLGGIGGMRVVPAIAKTIIALVDWNMELQEAINFPNIIKIESELEIEEGSIFVNSVDEFERLGHPMTIKPMNVGVYGIVVDQYDVLTGYADPRVGGALVGR